LNQNTVPAPNPAHAATAARAANALRALALNEQLKTRVAADATLRAVLERISHRYVAGSSTDSAMERVASILARGHAASAEYLGESCRDAAAADRATDVFVALIAALDARALPCSVSLDLSHVGMLVDPALGLANIHRIARAAAASERELMISMEGSDRTDRILDTYVRLHRESDSHRHVGITIQARLHRTDRDLDRLLDYPGRIRLVKGAYLESPEVAHPRDSPDLRSAYLRQARRLLASGHSCSIATHDAAIQAELGDFIRSHDLRHAPCEFESLIGLGTAQIDALRDRGFATREYAVYGEEHFLYVLNRISEDPIRLAQAVIDASGYVGT
jgi:proline dehydrogenase